ncbi:MAG: xanthine dehydrogenase family protein subunit M [Candidatus Caldarchaeum sp.]|nr:xanthine dehydrogenase family protein subunit M [Candidatus Caldarchaeum sp.]MDW8063088.1 xanthine dehydrogenase family protein subunit M [Candidatus Caldarchaeum sp.]
MRSLAYVDVLSPKTLEEALEILDKNKGDIRVLAGGTDLILQLRKSTSFNGKLVNIFSLDQLRYIRLEGTNVKIGALTDFHTIAESPIIQKHAPFLADAARWIGSVQILNKASIGGNIVNASPAADSLPALYVLEATLTLQSKAAKRHLPISEFYKGYKKLDLRPNELLVEISFNSVKENQIGMFFKHGLRQGDAISVVNGAVLLEVTPGSHVVRDARIALGAVAPTVVRAKEAEAHLKGKKLDEKTMSEVSELVVTSISPIDDVRGSAVYRAEMCKNYVYMTLWKIAEVLRS